MDDEITVSREMLKAIGAETRIRILKALKERQKTQSELAKELGLAAPTVLEHMGQLEKAGLIERSPADRERKWKYYRLTKTSEGMLSKKRVSVVMMLAGTSIAATVAFMLLYIFTPIITSSLLTSQTSITAEPPPSGSSQISYALTSLESSSQMFCGSLIMLGIIISIVLAAIALWQNRKKRI